jgi:GTP pyrophosphokinase
MVAVTKRLPDEGLTEADVEAWLDSLPAAQDPDKRSQLVRAVHATLNAFENEIERTGQQLVLYILHVADLLVHFELDDETLAAAVLYRGFSAGHFSEQELEESYSDVIVKRVHDLARIQRLTPGVLAAREEEGEEHSENLRRMLLAISNDVQVLLIILAERVHLMRRLGNLSLQIQKQFSRNTRDIFAPIANRLGIWQIKWELEDLSLRFLEPEAYRHIARQLEERREQRLAFIKETIHVLEEQFSKAGIKAKISGRPKHIFSIWKKMQRKDKDFSHIFDVRALRVLVDTVSDCYAALGIVHSLWHHLPKEFDDYIATPKANLYQSIHTVVVGDDGKPLEIQIRTHEMHEHAERGVAAHWRYKEQRGGQNRDLEKRIEWMRQWLEQRDGMSEQADDEEAEDSQHNIYVLSPQGKVIELPYGSTAVDFAYAIHSSVGHRCRGAKVDGRIAPLTQRLENGQTVEIITAKEEHPSRDWLGGHPAYVVTPRARNRIRQWYRQQDYSVHVEMGRDMLERELMRSNLPRPNLAVIAPKFNLNSDDDLYAAIGRGDVSPVQVASWEQRELLQKQREEQRRAGGERRRKKRKPATAGGGPKLVVDGIDSVMTKLGQCCKPVPGDPVIGFITRGHGITVHRSDCSMITRLPEQERERLIEVYWETPEEGGSGSFNVDIRIIGIDRKGLVRDISSIMANEDVDILSMRTHSDKKRNQAVMRFTVEVRDISELKGLIEKLSRMPDIVTVKRVTD